MSSNNLAGRAKDLLPSSKSVRRSSQSLRCFISGWRLEVLPPLSFIADSVSWTRLLRVFLGTAILVRPSRIALPISGIIDALVRTKIASGSVIWEDTEPCSPNPRRGLVFGVERRSRKDCPVSAISGPNRNEPVRGSSISALEFLRKSSVPVKDL